MQTRRVLTLTAGIGILLASVALGSVSALTQGPTDVPMLSNADLAVVGVTDATDVTAAPDQDLPKSPVSRSQAVALASGEVGRNETVRVLHGSASRYPGESPRSVWVIMYKGGVTPFDGPVGKAKEPITYRVTGVIVDDRSGELLSGFMF